MAQVYCSMAYRLRGELGKPGVIQDEFIAPLVFRQACIMNPDQHDTIMNVAKERDVPRT